MVLNQYTSLTWLLGFCLRLYQYESIVVEAERITAKLFSLPAVRLAIVAVSFSSL